MNLGLFIALLATAAVTPGQRANLTPQTAPTPAGMAYYLMSRGQVVSPPYPDPQSCTKALLKLKSTMQPGASTVVCAHRLP